MCEPVVAEVLTSQSFSWEIHHLCIQQRDDVTSIQRLSIWSIAQFLFFCCLFFFYIILQMGQVIDTVVVTEFQNSGDAKR